MERKRILIVACVVALALSFAEGAQAQILAPEDIGLDYSINLGWAFPVGDNAPDGNPMVGVAWYGSTQEFAGNSSLGFSVDWVMLERFDGKEVDVFPAMLHYRKYDILGGYRIYFDIGLGITYLSDNIPSMDMDNGANFGWGLGAGVDLTNKITGQVRYLASDKPEDDGILAVTVGYRF